MARNGATNTVRRRCGVAKQFFNAAQRKGLVESNPFQDLVSTVRANTERFYFVTQDEAYKVLEKCPDAEWRLLFALARFGGLRTPSESLRLRWEDIDWANGRMVVHSSKTEHHDGQATRVVPIFPELRRYLLDGFELAEPGAEYVITRYRENTVNLRTQLHRIIKRAGLKPWPKAWQNLRSTCETELAERFPMHVVCEWIGNSQPVAAEHYLQVHDEHYRQATAGEGAVRQAVRNRAQSARTPEQAGGDNGDFARIFSQVPASAEDGMGAAGFEPAKA